MAVFLPGLSGTGYGGAEYGYSPYGAGGWPRLPVVVTSGYGADSYGIDSYGSTDLIPPKVTGVGSLDGFRVEVLFSEEMADNAALTDAANYLFSEVYGAPLTATSVVGGTPGVHGGYTSVIVTHGGSTLGGEYTLTVSNLEDVAGNPMSPMSVSFYSYGDTSSAATSFLSPDDGRTVQLDFTDSNGSPQNLLTEAEFSPGVEDASSYSVTTAYPVTPTVSGIQQDPSVLSRVTLDVHPMTSTTYNLTVGPSLAYSYEGSVLPSDDPDLTGVETGTGTSAASVSGLFMSKAASVSYGWRLEDSTGRLLPNTTYRVDFEYDLTGTTVSPPVSNATFAVFAVSDGAVQVDVSLQDSGGTKIITVESGAFSVSVTAAWDAAGSRTLTLLRNQKGSFYSLLLDGTPLTSFAIASAVGAPTFSAGSSITLSTASAVSLFNLQGVTFTASSTLFTSSWNFIHNTSLTFTGSGLLARDRIKTKRGPLVRGWGDATPATPSDVEVRVDGTAVDIADVNPYIGEIYPTVPIPLSTPGTVSVEVDYIWFSNPAMQLAGLNTMGLGLNIWDRAVGHTPGAPSPVPSTATGALKNNRFPMGIVLAPYTRPSPKQIGHRYIGFQKFGYSALLNEPTTLLLNQNPSAISVGNVSAEAMVEEGSFNGQTLPGSAETPWTLVGQDSGVLVGDGTYRLIDATSGPYGVGDAAYYRRDLDLALDTVVDLSGRFKVESYTADGVFTGVGLGVGDGDHLFLIGALVVSGVKHLGVLLDGDNPHLEASWNIGPSAAAEATSQTTLTIPLSSLPGGISGGSRFRIATGSQAGVYTVADCGVEALSGTNLVQLTLTTSLPADISLYENDAFGILFEVDFETLLSIRAQVEFNAGSATASLGGEVSGTIATLTEVPAYPAQTALLIPAEEKGAAFWGSFSRRAENQSVWDFYQYTATPFRVLETVQGETVITEMNVLPQDDPNDPWYIKAGFGYSFVDAPAEHVIIKATSADPNIDQEFSYERVEPFISREVTTDLETEFQVDSGILGAGDVEVHLNDKQVDARFATLLYVQGTYTDPDTGLSTTGRGLVTDLPSASLGGLRDPVTAGWTEESSAGSTGVFVRGQTLEFTKASTDSVFWTKTLTDPVSVAYTGLILEARLSMETWTFGSMGAGFVFGGRVFASGNLSRYVGVGFVSGGVAFYDGAGALVGTISYDWTDQEVHTYRVSCDPTANIVVLTVDDVVVGSLALTSFLTSADAVEGFLGAQGDGAFTGTLHSLSVVPLRPEARSGGTLGRTFGILLRNGDPNSINGYKIPRSDGTSAANSSLSATPVLMDWTTSLKIRLLMDPTWGFSFYRPDIAPPPWYTGDYITQTTDPTAAWATVEYSQLPVAPKERGFVRFGSPNPESITQSRWNYMRYRIRGNYSGFGIAPQGMVINRYHTVKSAEYLYDRAPEVKTITSRTSTLLKVSDSAIYADRVFVVQVDGSVVPSTGWAFDKDTQNLIFNTALPSAQHPVTVTFAVGQPITKTYLCEQPIENSVTLLNEGTPPVPKSRDDASTSQVVFGAQINDPDDVLDDAESLVLNDPYRYVEFTDSENSLYADMQYCEVEDGESLHLSMLCDGPGPGEGLSEIGLSGTFMTNGFDVGGGPAGPWGRNGGVIRGTATRFDQTSILMASGGGYVDGSLNEAAVMYPNARGPGWEEQPPNGMGYNQELRLVIEDRTPREENFDLASLMGDNVPPSSADPSTDPNPDGTPGTEGNGAVAYILEDFSSSPVSRLGPWSGLTALEAHSFLAGGAALEGDEFTLAGGAALPLTGTVTTGVLEAAN